MTPKFRHVLDAIKSDPFRRNVDIALSLKVDAGYVSKVRQQTGLLKPKRPKPKKFHVTLPGEIAEWVKREAEDNKVSPSLFLASCITDAFVEATG